MNFKFTVEKEDGSNVTVTQPLQTESVSDKVNRLAKECGFDNISTRVIESFDWGDSTSTTVIFNRDPNSFYEDRAPIAGRFREYIRPGLHTVPDDYRGVVGYHTALIGYTAVTRPQSAHTMALVLKPVIEQGIKDLINQFGDIRYGYKVTMERTDGSFLKDLENSAAYEMRLTLIKE